MDDATLITLLAAAQLTSACRGARCRASAEPHRFYVDVVHMDPDANAYDCPEGDSVSYPRHTVSIYTLFETPREVLVANLAAWLSALHQHPASLTDGGALPIDADPTTGCASFDGSGTADGAGADPICWDSVASVPGD
jgi:hypothetical protein